MDRPGGQVLPRTGRGQGGGREMLQFRGTEEAGVGNGWSSRGGSLWGRVVTFQQVQPSPYRK